MDPAPHVPAQPVAGLPPPRRGAPDVAAAAGIRNPAVSLAAADHARQRAAARHRERAEHDSPSAWSMNVERARHTTGDVAEAVPRADRQGCPQMLQWGSAGDNRLRRMRRSGGDLSVREARLRVRSMRGVWHAVPEPAPLHYRL